MKVPASQLAGLLHVVQAANVERNVCVCVCGGGGGGGMSGGKKNR